MPPTPRGSCAVGQEESTRRSLLHRRVIDERGMLVADRLPGPVEVDHVFEQRVVRRQVGPAAEPGAVALGEEAEVGVDGRHVRVARVQDERDAGGGERVPSPGSCLANSGAISPKTSEKFDAGLLEDAPFARTRDGRRRRRAGPRSLRGTRPRHQRPSR